MATIAPTRQPFGVLDTSRLQALGSAKNRQNAITASLSEKNSFSPAGKRRMPDAFEDEFDSENIDPSIFNSPSKKAKAFDGTLKKVSKFSLTTVSTASRAAPASDLFNSPIVPQRHALSSPAPKSSMTPISHSRGSPKHKRIGLLSKRRTSSSPFKRIEPPSFGTKSAGLPFSLDAALSGSISSYKPMVEQKTATLEEAMPKSWFFEIHEDTAEEEATNLMEHSACVLDISSDDDCETRMKNEASERGKENVPPEGFVPANPAAAAGSALFNLVQNAQAMGAEEMKISIPRKGVDFDAMVEDRSPLGDLRAADYYGPGLDAASHVVVDGSAPQKPSGLSKEYFESPVKVGTKDFVEEKAEVEEVAQENLPIETITVWEEPTAATEGPAEGAVSQVMAEAQLWEDDETAIAATTVAETEVVETIAPAAEPTVLQEVDTIS